MQAAMVQSSEESRASASHLSPRKNLPKLMDSAKTQEEMNEVDRLRKERARAIGEIKRYKKLITYAIIFFISSFVLAICMVAWKFTGDTPSFEELRQRVISTISEEPRLCNTVFPNAIERNFSGSEVGEPLFLTQFIESGKIEEGAMHARVENIMQTEKSFSGFFTVNKTVGANLFFWYFPAETHLKRKKDDDQDDEDRDDTKGDPDLVPLVLWLQGGPGWPTMYGLFKENGPFLCGYEEGSNRPFLVPNKYSWTRDHHMLYIDNPVGAGFSFTENTDGYPRTDQEVGDMLIEAIRQFMIFFPFMTRGQSAKNTRFYAFGESYGGAYVVSLGKTYHNYQDSNPSWVENITFAGIGMGNGFISSTDQSLYAEFVQSLGYLTDEEIDKFQQLDAQVLKSYADGNYSDVILHSQAALHFFTSDIMNLTNIYDHTFEGNYLTNHEYICFLQQERVRKGIHVGDREFNKGYASYTFLNQSVMVSKKPWLNDILERGEIEVLVYNGNLDVIVHVMGTNKVVKSLSWARKEQFEASTRKIFWVWNEDDENGEIAGYFHAGGGLTYLIVRNAGHMVPISQPRWARQIVYEFTHLPVEKRFAKPKEIITKKVSAFENCSLH